MNIDKFRVKDSIDIQHYFEVGTKIKRNNMAILTYRD